MADHRLATDDGKRARSTVTSPALQFAPQEIRRNGPGSIPEPRPERTQPCAVVACVLIDSPTIAGRRAVLASWLGKQCPLQAHARPPAYQPHMVGETGAAATQAAVSRPRCRP
jgi:hypothetical protein